MHTFVKSTNVYFECIEYSRNVLTKFRIFELIVRTVLYTSNYVWHKFSGDTENCCLRNIRHLCEIE
jgi:hypothetical protein